MNILDLSNKNNINGYKITTNSKDDTSGYDKVDFSKSMNAEEQIINKPIHMEEGTKQFSNSVEIFDCMAKYQVSPVKSYSASFKTEIKNITYEESDKFKIAVMEGYTIKAKYSESSTKDEPIMYVELKYEDGTYEAVNVFINKVNTYCASRAEQFAYCVNQERTKALPY